MDTILIFGVLFLIFLSTKYFIDSFNLLIQNIRNFQTVFSILNSYFVLF